MVVLLLRTTLTRDHQNPDRCFFAAFRGLKLSYSFLGCIAYWVAVKELKLSYHIGENPIIYYIDPLW